MYNKQSKDRNGNLVFHTLSFVTFDGIVKYFADGKGELSEGEQTTDIRKAVKFTTSKEAEEKNDTLEAYYNRNTTVEIAPGIWLI